MGDAVEHHGDGLSERAQGHHAIGTQFCFYERQEKRAADRARPDEAEEHSIESGPAADLLARHQRQQRSIGAGEQKKTGGADQRRPQMLIMPGIAKPRQDRLAKALRRQQCPSPRRRSPP